MGKSLLGRTISVRLPSLQISPAHSALAYAEAVGHDAAPALGKALGAGQALAGAAGDGKGTVPLPAETKRCVGGRVLHQNGRVNLPGVLCYVVNILGVDMGGMAVAMLQPHGLLDGIVNVFCPDHP